MRYALALVLLLPAWTYALYSDQRAEQARNVSEIERSVKEVQRGKFIDDVKAKRILTATSTPTPTVEPTLRETELPIWARATTTPAKVATPKDLGR